MGYQDTDKNMRTIGEELGVATILEGGVQRAGDTVRINVQLIDSETDEHLWAQIYDRELTAENIFAIQSEMATAIADALQATLLPQEVARLNEIPTQSTRAYDFYLTGNDYLRRIDGQISLTHLAVEAYSRAVEEDPNFALAWANLSRAHSNMFWYRFDRSELRLSLALEAVQNAFRLAPDLPEAHLASGYYHYYGFLDYDSALTDLTIAEQGMPGDSQLFEARAFIFRRLGQWELSLATMARAIDLDPRNATQLMDQASTYALVQDYAQSDRYYERALEIDPDIAWAHAFRSENPLYRDGDVTSAKALVESPPVDLGDYQYWLGWIVAVYEQDYELALQVLDNWGSDPYDYVVNYAPKASFYGVTYQLAEQPEQAKLQFETARTQLEAPLETYPEDSRIYIALGEVLAGLGEREEAIRAARRAMELLPTSKDAYWGRTYQIDAIIRVFVPAGDFDSALQELDNYLGARGARWSIEGLLPDPRLDPIRDDPGSPFPLRSQPVAHLADGQPGPKDRRVRTLPSARRLAGRPVLCGSPLHGRGQPTLRGDEQPALRSPLSGRRPLRR